MAETKTLHYHADSESSTYPCYIPHGAPAVRPKPSVYLVMHGEGEYDSYGESAVGIFTTLEGALASLHRSLKVHNKDGSVSFRRGDTRLKTLTLDGCDTVYEHLLDSTDEPTEVSW